MNVIYNTNQHIDRFVDKLEVPIINSLIFPNGDLLVLKHTIIGQREKHIVNVLCKSTIDSYFEYNDIDSVSSCDTTTSTENKDYIAYAGEGSYGAEGIIYVIRKNDNQLVWFLFSDCSNPFASIEIQNNIIIAVSTIDECWIIPIHTPEKIKIKRLN